MRYKQLLTCFIRCYARQTQISASWYGPYYIWSRPKIQWTTCYLGLYLPWELSFSSSFIVSWLSCSNGDMGTRKGRSYHLLPAATNEWELQFARSIADTSSCVFRDLTEFVSKIVERATIRTQRQRSPLHRSSSAVRYRQEVDL